MSNSEHRVSEAATITPPTPGAVVCYTVDGWKIPRAALVIKVKGEEATFLYQPRLKGSPAVQKTDACRRLTDAADAALTPELREQLAPHWESLRADPRAKKGRAPKPEGTVKHQPLYAMLREKYPYSKAPKVGDSHVRIVTWNLKHFGATPKKDVSAEARARSKEEKELLAEQQRVHDEERLLNIVEVLHQSRCAIAALQEVSHTAKLDELCARLDTRAAEDDALALSRWGPELSMMGFSAATIFGLFWYVNTQKARWAFAWPHDSKKKPVGEHALVYRRDAVALALGCARAEDVVVEAAQHAQEPNLSPAFYAATRWSESPTKRNDFTFQGSRDARLPSLFFARDRTRRLSGASARTIFVCSVHLAFGPDTRARQLAHLSSLLPGAGCSPAECMYVLLGDVNSGASVEAAGRDFKGSNAGKDALAAINCVSPGHDFALPAGNTTSIAAERYDEVIVHGSAIGHGQRGRNRHAKVYPAWDWVRPRMREALPEFEQMSGKGTHMAFCNIFSDHLAVYVDLEFAPAAPSARTPPRDAAMLWHWLLWEKTQSRG